MWSIKNVKAEAKQILKKNYLVLVFITAVLLFLGILPGNGMEFASLSTTSITGQEVEAEEEYQFGLVRYLDSIVNGESKERQMAIAQDVLDSFNGRGGNVYGILRAVDRFIFTNDAAAKVLIVISTIVYLLFWFMAGNLMLVGYARIAIDSGKEGHKIQFADLFTVFRSNGYLHVTGVMVVWELFLDLLLIGGLGLAGWGATILANQGSVSLAAVLIILGAAVIAFFAYTYLELGLVPYILATNPKANLKECFGLSKAMMNGNKWNMVLLRLSYIGWDILSIFTFGLVNLLYIEPASYMAYGRVYLSLRQKALEENIPYSYLLERENLDLYPNALAPNKFGEMIENRNPIRKYSLVNIILMFFIFAFAGWCWEVLIHIVKDGVFVNRGTMHGPWLPIYGFGGAGICYFLNKLAKKPGVLIISIFAGCGVLEYLTHWYLELTKGTKWWDYSNYFLNLNGRICFEGLFVFCVAGVFAIYVAGPALDNLLNRVSDRKKWTVAGILLALFLADMGYSHKHPNKGKGITDYGKK